MATRFSFFVNIKCVISVAIEMQLMFHNSPLNPPFKGKNDDKIQQEVGYLVDDGINSIFFLTKAVLTRRSIKTVHYVSQEKN